MIIGLAAALAIVTLDRTSIRAAPHADAAELTLLWQGDAVEIRGEHAGYSKVYDYRRERGGYVKSESLHAIDVTEAGAPGLLAVTRFLRDAPGSEALGISFGAAYLKAAPARALDAEPFDAIGVMAERLADEASGSAKHLDNFSAHLEVVQQFGIHMRTFERSGRMQVCYDGELFRRVLTFADASSEQRTRAALALTRPECMDPDLTTATRASLHEDYIALLDPIADRDLSPAAKSRLRSRRASIWASIAFEAARRGESPSRAAEHALADIIGAHAEELGDERRVEYLDALLQVSASRWGAHPALPPAGDLRLHATAADPGQTCVTLTNQSRPGDAPLARRCTYGIVWLSSTQAIAQNTALVVAVQPLECWRELWVFHLRNGVWLVDVVSPAATEAAGGYVEFAGFAAASRHVLIASEVKDHGKYRRRFAELRLDDLVAVHTAGSPDALREFNRWQDAAWRRDTLALH